MKNLEDYVYEETVRKGFRVYNVELVSEVTSHQGKTKCNLQGR